uniref:Ig-like domain-containing protein n=1 Tax=Anser cygnoides TaxID=8845 RepID=A0A8B9EB48_ANSCY|nr:mucosal addressin cell adhesion molecule 1 [Anser cygnoides]
MEVAPLLLLSALWGCSGRPVDKMVVEPREPLVRYGDAVQLNCSLPCTGGTVQWKGLDTNLGSIDSFPTHSVLHINRAEVATAGTKICQGICGEEHYQKSVDLRVYSLPDALQLEAHPPALVPGQPATLRCSARRVYPPAALVVAWYRGDQELQRNDPDTTETDEELFDIEATLSVAGEDVAEGALFRCELTLSVGTEIFTREASVAVSTGAVAEQPVAVATSTESPHTTTTTMGSLSTTRPVVTTALSPELGVPMHDPTSALTTASQEPKTTSEQAAATDPPPVERPTPRGPIAGSPSARPATATVPSSSSTSPTAGGLAEAEGTAAGGTLQGSHVAGTGTAPACSLRIWSLPPNGTRGRALRIECHAQCAQNATVRWLRTPVALSQYREEVAGSGSTLRLDHAEPRHQGHYQCILQGHRSQAVSLQLVVSDDMFSADPAIAMGTTMSLLGLIVTGVISHRLWKRFKSQYELS